MELNVQDMTAEALLATIATEIKANGAQANAPTGGGRFGRVLVKLPNGQVFELSAEEIL